MAAYGTVRTYAERLDNKQIAGRLQDTLERGESRRQEADGNLTTGSAARRSRGMSYAATARMPDSRYGRRGTAGFSGFRIAGISLAGLAA
jgi:hypothetical protein